MGEIRWDSRHGAFIAETAADLASPPPLKKNVVKPRNEGVGDDVGAWLRCQHLITVSRKPQPSPLFKTQIRS